MKIFKNIAVSAAGLACLVLTACTEELRPGTIQEKKRFFCGNASMPNERVITGLYESADSSCTISLQLKPGDYRNAPFQFVLITPVRQVSGELQITDKGNDDVYYFSLKKIPWSDDGAKTNRANGVDTAVITGNKKAAAALQLKLDGDRVYIRNRGDRENNFCQLAECPGNYITLHRRIDTASYSRF